MRFDWWKLGGRTPPLTLVNARHLAHHALQWATKAARANIKTAADDSHSSTQWDSLHSALVSQPLPTNAGEVRVGLRLSGLALIVLRGATVLDVFQLDRRTDAEAGAWIDSKLQARGLRPASSITLPYAMPDHAVARGAPYDLSHDGRELGELARWFGGFSEALEEFKAKLAALRPGPGRVLCWPHHFAIATLVKLDQGSGASAKSLGVGASPGDEFYPQPYVYISPAPRFDDTALPQLPPPGHWHTQGFFGAVATAEEILALENRGLGLLKFITAAFEIGRARLGA